MALRIDGTTESLRRTANLPSLYTVCGWARRRSFSSVFSSIFGYSIATSSPSTAVEVAWDSSGQIHAVAYGGTVDAFTPSRNYVNGEPFFWAITGNTAGGADNCTFHVRGVEEFSLESGTLTQGSFTPAVLTFGDNGWGEGADHDQWNIKCWDRILTATELLKESRYEAVVDKRDLNFYWRLRNSGDLVDYGIRGRNPTPSGTFTPAVERVKLLRFPRPLKPLDAPAPTGNTGTAAITLDALTAAGTGALPIRGTAAVTLDALTAAGTGVLPIVGTAAVTLDALTAAGTGVLAIVGAGAATLGDLTAAGTGQLAIAGSAAATLEDLTVAGTGTVGSTSITGTAAITLEDLTAAGTGALPIVGAAAITLDALTAAGAGALLTQGQLAATFADLVAAGTALLEARAQLAVTLDDLTATGTGISPRLAALSVTLDDVTAAGQGILPLIGTLDATLGALTVSGAGNGPGGPAAPARVNAHSPISKVGTLLAG